MDKRLAPEKRIGQALRTARLAKNWSQEELSFECGLHRTYIGAVERGEKNLTLKNLVRLAKSLDVPASQIMANAGL
jgi:transcriptional regulator with XRE-family HTH domain